MFYIGACHPRVQKPKCRCDLYSITRIRHNDPELRAGVTCFSHRIFFLRLIRETLCGKSYNVKVRALIPVTGLRLMVYSFLWCAASFAALFLQFICFPLRYQNPFEQPSTAQEKNNWTKICVPLTIKINAPPSPNCLHLDGSSTVAAHSSSVNCSTMQKQKILFCSVRQINGLRPPFSHVAQRLQRLAAGHEARREQRGLVYGREPHIPTTRVPT